MRDDRDPVSGTDRFAAYIIAIAEQADRAAFGALFAHFAPRVKAYLLRLGAPVAVAEELSQEVMLAVWRKARYYDPQKSQASTWIFTIARNLRIDVIRRESHPEIDPQEPALETSQPPSADDSVLVAQQQSRLRQALESLPPEQAAVVRLSFFADKPHVDIGRDLGIPLGTVKSRLRLAMGRLRAVLGDML